MDSQGLRQHRLRWLLFNTFVYAFAYQLQQPTFPYLVKSLAGDAYE
jgi:hypothetical protein